MLLYSSMFGAGSPSSGKTANIKKKKKKWKLDLTVEFTRLTIRVRIYLYVLSLGFDVERLSERTRTRYFTNAIKTPSRPDLWITLVKKISGGNVSFFRSSKIDLIRRH